MELSQMRYFIEAAKNEHITKSAENLHIAQPALTKSIHNLEKELGVPLFTKKGRNITLTPYGDYLFHKLQPVIRAIDALPLDMAHMAEKEARTIRLSVLSASTIVTKAIIDYKKQCPDVHFHVLQNPGEELYDIEISTNLFYNNREETDTLFVCSENIFLAVPDTDRYKHKTDIRLAEVRDEGFISLFGSKELRSICDTFCHHVGFEPTIIFESDNLYAVKNMIGANLGVGFWPEFTWGEVDNRHVRLLPISDPVCRRDILLRYQSLKSDTSYARDFFEFLKNYFKEKKQH